MIATETTLTKDKIPNKLATKNQRRIHNNDKHHVSKRYKSNWSLIQRSHIMRKNSQFPFNMKKTTYDDK